MNKTETFAGLCAELMIAKHKYPTDTIIDILHRAIRLSNESNFSETRRSDEQMLIAMQKLNKLR